MSTMCGGTRCRAQQHTAEAWETLRMVTDQLISDAILCSMSSTRCQSLATTSLDEYCLPGISAGFLAGAFRDQLWATGMPANLKAAQCLGRSLSRGLDQASISSFGRLCVDQILVFCSSK
mmetsp:Transcript_137996/g.440760  ORF Transcript_137996/g.440760 Transcript_137996/m.440760 type:complete len:120 (-) Transcript_137996:21-380(-)